MKGYRGKPNYFCWLVVLVVFFAARLEEGILWVESSRGQMPSTSSGRLSANRLAENRGLGRRVMAWVFL